MTERPTKKETGLNAWSIGWNNAAVLPLATTKPVATSWHSSA